MIFHGDAAKMNCLGNKQMTQLIDLPATMVVVTIREKSVNIGAISFAFV